MWREQLAQQPIHRLFFRFGRRHLQEASIRGRAPNDAVNEQSPPRVGGEPPETRVGRWLEWVHEQPEAAATVQRSGSGQQLLHDGHGAAAEDEAHRVRGGGRIVTPIARCIEGMLNDGAQGRVLRQRVRDLVEDDQRWARSIAPHLEDVREGTFPIVVVHAGGHVAERRRSFSEPIEQLAGSRSRGKHVIQAPARLHESAEEERLSHPASTQDDTEQRLLVWFVDETQ